jgi:hypothetical protein
MSEAVDQIRFACAQCGSTDFIFPNQPPNDEDIISCNGCKREIDRYDVIKAATVTAAKEEVEKITTEIFGKKPSWS